MLLTGRGDVAHAVEAIRAGAEDFLETPYDATHLLSVIRRMLDAQAARREVARLQRVLRERDGVSILGRSRAMRAFRARIAELASVDLDVVIRGETGTGKKLAARAIHAGSARGWPLRRAQLGGPVRNDSRNHPLRSRRRCLRP